MGGFSIVPLAQKARTKTLIADSDLNLGNYDLIATDVKGDTAEFSEFVGGVGNFDSALIRGNTQVDGNIVLEGAINNVNIDDNGEITTSHGVNGATFNGVPIKRVVTVTPNPDYTKSGWETAYGASCILPQILGVLYTGGIQVWANAGSSDMLLALDSNNKQVIIQQGFPSSPTTYTFENIKTLYIVSNNNTCYFSIPFLS